MAKVKAKTPSKPSPQFLKDIWPQERDFMERPERYKYVRKLVKQTGCVFCETLNGKMGFPNLLLFKNQNVMVVLNKYPYNSGHVMILPRKHVGSLTDLTVKEYDDVAKMLFETVRIVKAEYDCKGMNIGLNMGEVAGAGIPDHLHWHVIPRWTGDTNFFPLIAETKVLPETLEQTFTRYRAHFSKLDAKLEK